MWPCRSRFKLFPPPLWGNFFSERLQLLERRPSGGAAAYCARLHSRALADDLKLSVKGALSCKI